LSRREQSLPFYNYLLKTAGICARTGGWVKHIQICLCLKHNPFIGLPLSAVEDIEFRVTTKHRYGSASVAVRAEKRASKYEKIIVLFSEIEMAKQNQKFPFHFLSAPPTPPAEEKKKGRENFWFLHTRVRERVRAHWFASPRNRSVRGSFKPPRAPRMRSQGFCSKWVLTFSNKHHMAKKATQESSLLRHVDPRRFELLTSSLQMRRSNQLSYGPLHVKFNTTPLPLPL
jgi:hypothetical protein